MRPIINIEELRQRARRRLPRMVFDYLEGGAGGERGLVRNRTALDRILFNPHRLTDVSHRDSSVELFGKTYPLPMVIAPTGLNAVLRPDGDILLARAAAQAGIPFCLSTASTTTIEDLARRVDGEHWFQLYVVQQGLAETLVKRALNAGYETLILTVDVAVNGKRERDMRSGFKVPFRYTPRIIMDAALHPSWSVSQVLHGLPHLANFTSADASDPAAQAALMNRQMDASFDWVALKRLRDPWPHRLLVKGITNVTDAAKCASLGVDGVILSNHGGRQLEDTFSPIEVLGDVKAKLDIPILVDSGIRSGADIAKALAMGATAVLIGRAVLYGLAAHGEKGVNAAIGVLSQELDTTLALTGCAAVGNLGPQHLAFG
ncbi:alpha-hydroxy-acid oxidizing protein [Rhizobium leguminosarum]|uniref:alpha-hydroxy-acid oxidizing protein n=1 Tax=Rhizobium leguminosarum TaxID=384 RepID=UPI003ECD10BC